MGCECHDSLKHVDLKQLCLGSRHERYLLREWERVYTRLATTISPQRLRLCIICESADRDTAERFHRPFRSLPRLAACSVRLSPSPDTLLQSLANNISKYMTQKPSENFSRFLDLPDELRSQILSHTGFVAPFDISWCSNTQKIAREGCCHKCSDTLEPCCCAAQGHAASPQMCTCWYLPTSLFRVNSAIGKEALRISYAENHSVITHSHVPMNATGNSPRALLKFLLKFHHRNIKLLRRIDLKVSVPAEYIGPRAWALELTKAVKILQDYAQLPRLHFRLDIYHDYWPLFYDHIGRMIPDGKMKFKNAYKAFVDQLSPLEVFNIRIWWPVNGDPEREQREREELECCLTRRVLGASDRSVVPGSRLIWSEFPNHRLMDTTQRYYGPDGAEIWPLEWKQWLEGAKSFHGPFYVHVRPWPRDLGY